MPLKRRTLEPIRKPIKKVNAPQSILDAEEEAARKFAEQQLRLDEELAQKLSLEIEQEEAQRAVEIARIAQADGELAARLQAEEDEFIRQEREAAAEREREQLLRQQVCEPECQLPEPQIAKHTRPEW